MADYPESVYPDPGVQPCDKAQFDNVSPLYMAEFCMKMYSDLFNVAMELNPGVRGLLHQRHPQNIAAISAMAH